jgi:hypothetical protein
MNKFSLVEMDAMDYIFQVDASLPRTKPLCTNETKACQPCLVPWSHLVTGQYTGSRAIGDKFCGCQPASNAFQDGDHFDF